MSEDDDIPLSEVLIEMQPIGRYMRVNAMDPRTLVEVTTIADASYSQTLLKKLAVRKLKYVLRKRRGAQRPKPRGRGFYV